MRKNNVWKQALALVLSATLVLGNVSPVSAATGDAGTGEGATGPSAVSDTDAAEALELTANGTVVSSGDGYEENGIKFVNNDVEIVDAPIITPDSAGATTGDDGGHGRVFKFNTGTQNINNVDTTTGVSYMTSEKDSLKKYDFSRGVTVSFDIYPEAQHNVDWNYFFVVGVFEESSRNTLTATTGLRACFDSQKRKEEKGASWEAYYPAQGWITENKGSYEWDYFGLDANKHKWYNLKYVYTPEGLTIEIDGKPVVSYPDPNGYVADVLTHLKDGQLRLGKGVLTTLEGYEGLMDNFRMEPVAPHQHTIVSAGDGRRVEPTCTENGYVQKGQCSECGVIVEEIIPALGHKYGELEAETEATCTRPGYEAHYECERSGCGKWAVDGEDGKKKEVESDEIKIDALGHDYEHTSTKKATPEEDGSIVETCKRAGCSGTGHTRTTNIPKASDITLAGTEFTYNGGEFKPAVTVKDSKGTVISADNYNVEYSNNVQVGTATVKITFKGDNYEGTATKTFTIKAATAAANLVLDKSSVTLYTGNAQKSLTIKVTTVTGASQTVTWKSDNDKIAKVDNKGKITAVKAGTTNVRATANGVTKVVKVTVKNPTITLKSGKKKFTKKTVNVKRKKKTTLTVSVSPSKSGFKLGKMTSKQKKIAKVSLNKKGKLVIQGKKKGSFKIKITSGKATKTLTIKVK